MPDTLLNKKNIPAPLTALSRLDVECVQVNMGLLCNNKCVHCHLEAGPHRTEVMGPEIVEEIIGFIKRSDTVKTLDITGGAPELNPHIKRLINGARQSVSKIIVRTNLTAISELKTKELPAFFKNMKVDLTASLPCYLEENVNNQRGKDVYSRSIKTLMMLNSIGYGLDGSDLVLNLVYNPNAPTLPPPQKELENAYKKELQDRHGVFFNNLYTITNVPIKRFAEYLNRANKLDDYLDLLEQKFNENTLRGLMCRTQINVAYDGKIYDCDFNQALHLNLYNGEDELSIFNIDPVKLRSEPIITKRHCLACTAGSGSSCGGSLV